MKLIYFAAVREALGRDEEVCALADAGMTIASLLDHLVQSDALYAAAFKDRSKLRFALDHKMVKGDAVLGDAKELAIFPPVTGG